MCNPERRLEAVTRCQSEYRNCYWIFWIEGKSICEWKSITITIVLLLQICFRESKTLPTWNRTKYLWSGYHVHRFTAFLLSRITRWSDFRNAGSFGDIAGWVCPRGFFGLKASRTRPTRVLEIARYRILHPAGPELLPANLKTSNYLICGRVQVIISCPPSPSPSSHPRTNLSFGNESQNKLETNQE